LPASPLGQLSYRTLERCLRQPATTPKWMTRSSLA